MKKLLLILKLFSFTILLSYNTLYAESIPETKDVANKVFRTDRIGDSYHFLLLTEQGTYYHVFTNRTDNLSVDEIKSPNIITILKNKQSWGKSFPKKGNYTVNNGKIYTKRLWNRIKIISNDEIKYLNKIFKVQ